MKLKNDVRERIKKEQEKILIEMGRDNIPFERWQQLQKMHQGYEEMLKPAFKVSPDVIFAGAINLAGILLVLNFEKIDIVRSKAFNMIVKGKL